MYYIDTTSFSTATAVYTDQLLTVKAPDGYYKFGSGYRQQLDGVLLNNIQCTTCIDCKEFISFTYKTGVSDPEDNFHITITYTDCWGYDHTISDLIVPATNGQANTIILSDYDLGGKCVKNGSVQSFSTGFFIATYGDNPQCDTSTGLIQAELCSGGGSGSETPTGCSIPCGGVEASTFIYIPYSSSNYLSNGDICYFSNDSSDVLIGGDLYYKVYYNNVYYGVRISDLGVISELTYCNP